MRKLILLTGTFVVCLILSFDFLKKVNTPIFQRDVYAESGEHESEEHETDEPLKFLEFHKGIRTRDNETEPGYAPGAKWSELARIRNNKFAQQARARSNGVIAWTERGPGNVPGRTRSLYNVPGDPSNNTWLAGSATGGIWRTTDGGDSWTEVSKDFPALPISSFGSDVNGDVIYASTGEFVSTIYSAIGNGIFKSIDQGQTWMQLPATSTEATNYSTITTRLVVAPDDANTIVATTAPHSLSDDDTSAIMRSTDGGISWTKVLEVEGVLEQVVATPGNFAILYATQNGVGVWKSIDGGQTWSPSSSGMSPNGRIELSVSPVDTNTVYASVEGTKSGAASDLYYSRDAGETWKLIDVRFDDKVVDFFDGQGMYDNTILADPFDANIVYFGGVSLFRTTIGSGTTAANDYAVDIVDAPYVNLLSFSNYQYANQRLNVGTTPPTANVEIRFGPGKSQKAHRFLVPVQRTSGVAASEYSYVNYVDVPFEVWDVTGNTQLMISFRDQNRNGKLDLLPQYFSTTPTTDYLNDSREYIFIQDINYSLAPSSTVSKAGGQEANLMYNFAPSLAAGQTWDPDNLPEGKIVISYAPISKRNATTVTVADGRDSYDGKNGSDQTDLTAGVHPDHHFMIPLLDNIADKKWRLLIGNDGGVFVSKQSTTPGITEGDWTFRGLGYNTSQFYGADKKPGAEEYFGGMQDNGTRVSRRNEVAGKETSYDFAIGGDGFEVLWHSGDPNRLLGTVYNGAIYRSTNGGGSFSDATGGLPSDETQFSFVTKLANSKSYPNRVFTVGSQGVYTSETFGGSWKLTAIPQHWIVNTPFYLDVEVSRSNANIVWAGGGMSNESGQQRNLFVSVDGGKTFSETNNYTDVTLGNITKLASHPVEDETAYAIFSFAKGPKILRTTDLGETWEDISGFGTNGVSNNGFPDVAVYCLYVRPDDPNILWAGTEIGIVESVDNGATWAIIEDFPKVGVWDMKGQDDQVVIATHGRGIWTATLDQPQSESIAPSLVAYGNAPDKELMIRIASEREFDSARVFVNNAYVKTVKDIQIGNTDFSLGTVAKGDKTFFLIGYIEGEPFQSMSYAVTVIDILSPANSYTTFFEKTSDLVTDLTSLTISGSTRKYAQTGHPYTNNTTYSVMIKTPVTVSSANPTITIEDMLIAEPGKDSVVIEATLNGLDWLQIGDSYDASFNPAWSSAYSANSGGNTSMFVPHAADIKTRFDAGDLLLFRVRFITNESNNAWGWGVHYIAIQEVPTATSEQKTSFKVSCYPNPTTGVFTLEYELPRSSVVDLQAVDISGKTMKKWNFGTQPAGKNTKQINISEFAGGNYILILNAGDARVTKKITLKR